MFCENCGAGLPERANFCVHCGGQVRAAAPPPVYEAPPAAVKVPVTNYAGSGVPAASATESQSGGKCKWCGAAIDADQQNCPKCGAATILTQRPSRSGWAKLPGRKDMAKLNFGNSVCQIEGVYVPVADMKLAAGDWVYFTHNVLLWKDPQVQMSAMSLQGAWKRLMGGLPLIMTQAQGPGHIAFSQDGPGELIALPLQPGQSIDVREHLFLAATGNIQYDWFQTNIWFQTRRGNDNETHYPLGRVMDRFASTEQPGLLLLHAAGNVFVRELAPGQTILLKPSALVFKDPSVNMALHYERPNSGFVFGSGQTYLWLRVAGPGRIAIQSVFDRIEGESNITGASRNPFGGMDIGGEVLGGLLEGLFDS
jgi:uncharacterized protein (AIM24 family)/RNA polymerase subunit RPABC4/transcription elongation factor Spt4